MAGDDSLFDQVLASLDPNTPVIDLDGCNERLQVGLAERHRPAGEVLLHHATEPLDEGGIDPNLGRQVLLGSFQGGVCLVTLGFKRVQSVLEDFIKIRDPVFDKAVKALERNYSRLCDVVTRV